MVVKLKTSFISINERIYSMGPTRYESSLLRSSVLVKKSYKLTYIKKMVLPKILKNTSLECIKNHIVNSRKALKKRLQIFLQIFLKT